ncbi:MAG: class I SAM-dependent methyltransferase [Pseudomonadota bacterium]
MVNWDRKYEDAGPGQLFGHGANSYVRFVKETYGASARNALCLADGDGRNGRWLAQAGLDVTAVDLSQVATDFAQNSDAESGVRVERICADLTDWEPPQDRTWDLVFVMYLQCEMEVRLRALGLGLAALASGGVIALEGFAQDQSKSSLEPTAQTAGPKDVSLLYSADMLEAEFSDAVVLEILAGRIRLDEGQKHQGLGHVIRFCARKT